MDILRCMGRCPSTEQCPQLVQGVGIVVQLEHGKNVTTRHFVSGLPGVLQEIIICVDAPKTLKSNIVAIDQLDLPLTQLEEQILGWVKEALELRFAQDGEYLSTEHGADPVLSGLLNVRGRLDRIEELLTKVTRARGRAQRARMVAQAVADDAWDTQSQVELQAAQRRPDQFVAPRERYANSNLETLHQKRDLRAAERLAHSTEEAYEVIRTVHRGLDSIRNDHLAVIRALSWESHMERGSNDRGY